MSAPTLRPYQDQLFDALRTSLRQHQRALLQSPTGSGKGVLIAYMVGRTAESGESAWLTCHRRELVDQLSASLHQAGVRHGIIAAGRRETRDPIQVASIQTLANRLDRLDPPRLLAIDEAHHVAATTWRKVTEHCRGSLMVGLTATPSRLDGRGLDDTFNDIVLGPTVAELIEQGYLAPYRLFAPAHEIDLTAVHSRGGDYVRRELEEIIDQSGIVGDAVSHYRRLVAPSNCLVFCVSRAHARHVTAAYQAAGIDARYCAGDTPKNEREKIVAGLGECRPAVVVSVDLFSEGLDVPNLKAVQFLRPTQSLVLYLQMVGRAMRPEPGKDHAIILDHVRNSFRHGLPDDDREWSLQGRKRLKASEEPVPALRHCPECFSVFRAILGACPQCGWVPEIVARLPVEHDGELEEIDRKRMAARKRQEVALVANADGMRGIVQLAIARDYKFGWAARYWHSKRGVSLSLPECFRLESSARKELMAGMRE